MIEIKPIDYKEVKERLNQLNLISPSSEWKHFVENYLSQKAMSLGFFEGGNLNAILPAFISKDDILEGVPKLYTEIIFLKEGFNISKEDITNYAKASGHKKIQLDFCPIISEDHYQQFDKRGVAHVLKLFFNDEERILTEVIEHKTRNQIRVALKSGFELRINDELEPFWGLYLKSIKRLRSLPKDRIYFENLKASFGDKFKIIYTYKDGEAVGANLVLLKNHYLHLPFNVSEATAFKYNVNNFLYWETIKFGIKQNISIFDFGPAILSDISHHHFKEGFGAIPIPIYRFVYYNSFSAKLSDLLATKKRNLILRLKKLI